MLLNFIFYQKLMKKKQNYLIMKNQQKKRKFEHNLQKQKERDVVFLNIK